VIYRRGDPVFEPTGSFLTHDKGTINVRSYRQFYRSDLRRVESREQTYTHYGDALERW
jgi:hypothetical protein